MREFYGVESSINAVKESQVFVGLLQVWGGEMFLKQMSYEEHRGHPNHWKLERLTLGRINLVVGKNSSGKTRLLNVVGGLSRLVSGRIRPHFTSGTWDCEFERSKGQATEAQRYELELKNKIVASEKFSIRKTAIMERNLEGLGFVRRRTGEARVRYKVPLDQLMAVVRRDEIQHPHFEHLFKWGQDLCHYRFGTELGKNNVAILGQRSEEEPLLMSEQVENAAHVYKRTLERFGDQFKASILEDLRQIGFPCSDILLTFPPSMLVVGLPPAFLAVQEEGLDCQTLQTEMSQGMYRALAILVQVNANIFWAQSKKVGRSLVVGDAPMILVDDIGEGLDFERARALISVLIEKTKKFEMQLVMSSNDRFIMNDVPLEYWTVLHRKGAVVRVYNAENSANVFNEFQYLGLNNFDFFAGEYFLQSAK